MSAFDASPAMLGFLHQMRWALYELLVAIRRTGDETIRISLETYDDVAIHDEGGRPFSAVQLKQHNVDAPPLSDGHVDLWKTLRVWLSNQVLADPNGPRLFLLTTADVAEESAPSHLLDGNRDAGEALRILDEKASTLQGDATATARSVWIGADRATKLALLERVTVVPDAPRIHDVDNLVGRELLPTVSPKRMDEFLHRLWGWWDSCCIEMLNPDRVEPRLISASDLLARMRTLRDEIREEALSIEPESAVDEISIESGYDERFIDQLRWINANASTLHRAIVDYLRAYAHTTRWLRDGELFGADLDRYERDLKAEWDIHFGDMCAELEMDGVTDEKVKARAGWDLFKLLRDSTKVLIRTGFPEAFHARGTRYRIANSATHGWHPDFEQRIAALLGAAA